ncbi:MAG: bifunctional ADP-dependent NAD(P)H-hydrate dehydratase/NAD(P)H-hydrate epimerase [Gammaproteobacteria bacterium]|nr:bifunctional ADP-dependent NAD(P)H-hydrate dehydratase/NAD(P)H-hydrate epimerase [Gammaproteobacteria bacterium]MBK80596.1 bifunctional ADP-dependent NAD(P)H-hydrate dehydratase/NAD(P)H-hydrate epimerase [Gammaproteobacteria bacterium]
MATPEPTAPELYGAADCRALDRAAIDEFGTPGFELMQRAGRAAFRVLLDRWPGVRRLTVCCGRGNNAGDGYLVAGLAREIGLEVTLWQLGDPGALAGDAGLARDFAAARGVVPMAGPPPAVDGDVVVDALLGTGIRGELKAPFDEMVRCINASGRPVLAIDLPTGVDADTGAATRDAVKAAVTVTFIGRKLGLYTGPGASLAGRVVFDDLGVPAGVYRRVRGCPWLRYGTLPADCRLGPRDANAYKHALGHVVVVGGDHAMGGAPLMAAEAALRAGAGMVSVVTRPGHRPAILARRPEVMVVDGDDSGACRAVLDKARVLVVGPGLGGDDWGRALLEASLARSVPTVLDADGLNLFAAHGLEATGPLIVTPHVAEAARLLGWEVAAVQQDRPGAVRALAQRVRGVAVLKGAGTLIGAWRDAEPVLLGVCAEGNPGMASAGMGDVLSGVLGGLLGQGLDPQRAALAGTCLHGAAGDAAAARLGQRSLLASDLTDALVEILAREERGWA